MSTEPKPHKPEAKPRKRVGETVAAFLRRRDHKASPPPLQHRLPDLIFSWWFAVIFVLIVLVMPVALAILWTYPRPAAP